MLVRRDGVGAKSRPRRLSTQCTTFSAWGEIVAGLVLAGHVVFAQPGPLLGLPAVQVLRGRARELVLAEGIAQAERKSSGWSITSWRPRFHWLGR